MNSTKEQIKVRRLYPYSFVQKEMKKALKGVREARKAREAREANDEHKA